ncbi:MAG TPA: MFS transporter [Bryobacteraceae bacterium]|nr:MFS transporter [Bryobacteraceae bacterium]
MPRLRWRIAFLVSSAIAISYFDRQTLPVAIKAIQNEIPVTNFQFGQLNLAFLLAYGAMYAAGGKLIDVLGTRTGFFLIMVWWSLACASHGLAAGFGMLAASRLLLGMGEGGGFPAATKAVAEWFPVAERSTAMGIMNAGTAVGAVIAPPGIALVIGLLGWRWVFFISGAIGLAWTAWWRREYYVPERQEKRDKPEACPTWLQLLRFRQVWGLVSAKFLSDAAWYIYMGWLAKYLYDVRGFDTAHVGYFAWIPFAASGVGSLLGGWFSSRLIRAGRSLDFSRKMALGASAAMMPWIFFVTRAPVQWAIVLFSLAFFGQQSWSTLVMIVPADIFPRAAVGSVAGLVGMGGALGGAVFNLVVGYMLDHGTGYGAVFGMLSTFHVIGFIVILLVVRRVKPLETT